MAHPELELVSNIVESGSMTAAKKRGVTPDFFQTEEGSIVFQWIWDQYHDPKHRGEVPDRIRLLRKFPDFDFCPSRNAVDALISEVRDTNLMVSLDKTSAKVAELLNDGEDPTLILQAYLSELRDLNCTVGDINGLLISEGHSFLKQEYETKQAAGGITGIPFPWAPLNTATGGMHPEQFIVLYGRPKNGKTMISCHIAAESYRANRRVLFFSKEMRREDLLRRCAADLAGIDYGGVVGASLSEDDKDRFFEVLENLEDEEAATATHGRRKAMCFISDKGQRKSSTTDDLIARAEQFEPDLLVVDGFYLMRDGRTNIKSSDWRQIAHISQDLKAMAQYLEVPVLGTTQANRANAKTPTNDLDDLSYADAIGQDADLAMRCFLGPHPTGKGSAVVLTFPGVREAELRPFMINYRPGLDFSLYQKSVNVQDFLKAKSRMDQDNEDSDAAKSKKAAGKRQPTQKRGKMGLRA